MKSKDVVDVAARVISGKTTSPGNPSPGKLVSSQVPGATTADGLTQMFAVYTDYKRLRETEITNRVVITAEKEVAIEKIRAQRDIFLKVISDSAELRKLSLEAQINAMDKAIAADATAALQIVMDGMVKTLQTSSFKDVADMQKQFASTGFVLKLR